MVFISICILFFISKKQSAQNLSIRQLPVMEHLPSNSVVKIFQDKEGYMWFGTQDGLCRYDGYSIKTFRSDHNNLNLLASNEISSINEDYNDNLWIGTNKGLNILNTNTFEITDFPDSTMKGEEIYSILVSSDSTIWIGYNYGVNRYKQDFTLIDQYTHSNSKHKSFPNTSVNCIYEDSYNNIWITTWKNGLFRFNKGDNKFEKYPKVSKDDNPFKMFQDDRNNYWMGTWKNGLYKFSPNSDSVTDYYKVRLPDCIQNKRDNTFFSFVQDDYFHYIWSMSLLGLSTFKYDNKGEIVPVNMADVLKKTNNIFSDIIKDRHGDLWVGAYSEGVFKIEFSRPSVDNFPLNLFENKYGIAPSFTSLCEDGDGDIWFNQNRLGLFMYSKKNKEIKSFQEIDRQFDINECEKSSYVNYLKGNDEIWVIKDNSSIIYEIKKKHSHIVSTTELDLAKKHINPGAIEIVYEDKQKNVWIGTQKGLFMQKFGSDDVICAINRSIKISAITQDVNGSIWFSTFDDGFFKLNRPKHKDENTNTFSIDKISKKGLTDNIQSISADLSGFIWIGTKDGCIYCYNIGDNSLYNRTGDSGLKGKTVLDLITDKYNNVWITTYKSVIEFNPKSNAFYKYSTSDGIQINSHLKGSLYKTKDSNRLYIAGNRGYTQFSPSDFLLLPAEKCDVKICDVKIDNVTALNSNKFNKHKQLLVLSPEDKNIEFYFSTLNYENPEKIKYAYMLEGVDEDWTVLVNGRNFVNYNNLKRGKYVLKVKATDSRNLWSNNIRTLKVIRKPAFYESNIAYFIYVLIVLCIVILIILVSINRIKLTNRVKITQLEKKNVEELSQAKLKYFTNISHDLLTPLTVFSCLIDDIESSSRKFKPQLALMRFNVQRLKRLLQQVLDYKRVEEGKLTLNVTNSNIVSFVERICYDCFWPLFTKKNIKFIFKYDNQVIDAYFDTDIIDKVLYNLLSNAIKYTPENGIISVKVSTDSCDVGFVCIMVEDTGIGIQKTELTKIFNRFYSNKILTNNDSHGIGLSLCKELIELHKGKIQVESDTNIGTKFSLYIPIDKDIYDKNEIRKDIVSEINDKQSGYINFIKENDNEDNDKNNNKTILIVEDNVELIRLMKHILSKSYKILTASNGQEALEILKDNSVNIVVSDIMMPVMNGLELCKTMKSANIFSSIPIILLTAKNNLDDKMACYNAGADEFITKPFEMKYLEMRISNLIAINIKYKLSLKEEINYNISSSNSSVVDQDFIDSVIKIIEKNLSLCDFDVNMLSEELNVSKSTLYRRMKAITGLSTVEFVRKVKMKHSALLLKTNKTVSVTDVAYAVGYSDPRYFSACFKSEYKITPSEYAKQVENIEESVNSSII